MMVIAATPEHAVDDRPVLYETGDEAGRASAAGHDVLIARPAWPMELAGARVTVRRLSPYSGSVEVAGEIDLLTVGALSQCLLAAVELPGCRELLVDLGGVEFLGAKGIGVLAQAHTRAVERAMVVRLVAVSSPARRALEVSGARDCFDTWPAQSEVGAAEVVDEQARAVSQVQQRRLATRAVLAQAAGVLAGHTGAGPAQALAALYEYAERHRFVVSELARDIVAGRMAARTVAAPAHDRELTTVGGRSGSPR